MFVDSKGLGKHPSHILRIDFIFEDLTRSGLGHFINAHSLDFTQKRLSPFKPHVVMVSVHPQICLMMVQYARQLRIKSM